MSEFNLENQQESKAEEREALKFFYHVSTAKLNPGDVLSPGQRGYVCLATSIEQAIYWAHALYGEGRERSDELGDCAVYKVKIEDENTLVEDCIGHYSFEYPGEMKKIDEIKTHPSNDLDGEINVRNSPVVVVDKVDINVPQGVSEFEKKKREELKKEIEEDRKKFRRSY